MPLGETTTDRDRSVDTRYAAGQATGAQNLATFPKPGILVLFDGRPHRQIAALDWPGASLAVMLVDEDGRQSIERMREVTVIDTDILPLTRQQFTNLTRTR